MAGRRSVPREEKQRRLVEYVPNWWRGPADVREGVVAMRTRTARQYNPEGHATAASLKALPWALANLVRPKEQGVVHSPEQAARIVAFVGEFGPLEHGPQTQDALVTEPVSLYTTHAMAMRRLFVMDDHLQLGAKLENLERERWRVFLEAKGYPRFKSLAELQQQLAHRMAATLEAHLKGVRLVVMPERARISLGPASPSLLTLAWFKAAQYFSEPSRPLLTCACGLLFEPHDWRQRFCTPACSNRHRQRKHQQRQRRETAAKPRKDVRHGKATR